MKEIIITSLLFIALCISAFSAERPIAIYVSPSGNDANSGTASSPFRTIVRAQEEIRRFRNEGHTGNRFVYLRGGVYELAAPVYFGYLDGGDLGYSVTYLPSTGENVTISGGRKLTHWTEASPGIVQIDLEKMLNEQIAALEAENVRATAPWDKEEARKAAIAKARKSSYAPKPYPAIPLPVRVIFDFDKMTVNGKPAVWKELPLEEDGQFFLESETQTVFYKLRHREKAETLVAYAPVLREVFIVSDSPEKNEPVRNLFFEKLNWVEINSEMPFIQYVRK